MNKTEMKNTLIYHKILYKLNHFIKRKDKFTTKILIKKITGQRVQMFSQINMDIQERLKNNEPTFFARLGGTEGVVAGQYCEKLLGMRTHYSEDIINWLYTTSGFFSDDYDDKEKAMDEYAQLTLDGLSECDYLSAMFPSRDYVPFLFKYYAKKAVPTFSDYGPHYNTPTNEDWTGGLEGKKVLVINSFTDSIKHQYDIKDKLVKSKEYELPDFELITYKTLVTQVGERPHGLKNFFEAYNYMLDEIKKIDFDIALVGAGAYGFPLSVEIRKMGKSVMETCGQTTLFFGIYNERFLAHGGEPLTDHWIRPLEEPPKKFKEIENGCYW